MKSSSVNNLYSGNDPARSANPGSPNHGRMVKRVGQIMQKIKQAGVSDDDVNDQNPNQANTIDQLLDHIKAAAGAARATPSNTLLSTTTDPEENLYKNWLRNPSSLIENFSGGGRSVERSQMLERFMERRKKELGR